VGASIGYAIGMDAIIVGQVLVYYIEYLS
jgi:hypothetical protein